MYYVNYVPLSTKLLTCTTGAQGQVPISGLNSTLDNSANDRPRRMQSTSFQELSMVHPIRSP